MQQGDGSPSASQRGSRTVVRAVAQFAVTGLLAVVLLGAVGVQLLRSIGTSEAIRNAKQVTRLAGEGIVAPDISTDALAGRPGALARLDRVVRLRVLRDPVVRVKVWDKQSRIIYSDEHRLVGSRYALGSSELRALRAGGTQAEVSNLARPENRFERSQGKLLEVYHGVRAADGQQLLFEAYLRFSSVSASGQRLWLSFAPAMIAALVLLELAQIPLAWSLAHRLRRGQQEREMLLQRAINASDVERQRIAGDLHDGVVQNLAGVSYSLSAAGQKLAAIDGEPEVRETLDRASRETRQSIRALRSLLVDLYPPDLHRSGLPAALTDLLAHLSDRQIATTVEIDPELRLPPEVEVLFYRAAREALQNVVAHARASRVVITAKVSGATAALTVEDDGRGFDPGADVSVQPEGHFGLRILRDLAADAGGRLSVDSTPGHGTRVRVESPAR